MNTTRLVRALSTLCFTAALAACGGGGDEPAPVAVVPPPPPPASAPATPKVRVFVADVAAAPLEGVRAEVVGGSASAMTGADGNGSFDLGAASNVLVRFSKPGYADNFKRATFAPDGSEALLRIALRARDAALSLDASAGGSVVGRHGATVDLPASGLVDAETGAAVSGIVDVALTSVDVSGPDRRSFPGPYAGIAADGTRRLIASYGTTEFALTQGGRRLNLAPGRTATIEIPIYTPLHRPGVAVAVGDTIPLWSLDEQGGVWKQEGTGTVVAQASSPTGFAMRATVGHFSWWNCDDLAAEARFDLDLDTPDVDDKDHVEDDRPPDQIDDIKADPNLYRIGPARLIHIDATTADDSFLVAAGIDFESVFMGEKPMRKPGVVQPVLENWLLPGDRVMAITACTMVKRGGNRFGEVNACGTVHATVPAGQRARLKIKLKVDDLRNLPYIVAQPAATTVEPGMAASFTVDAVRTLGGTDDLSYQWTKNGVPIAGATGKTYTVAAATLADHNTLYSVSVTAPPGAVLSRPARLSVVAPPPPPPPPSGNDRWVDAALGNDANPGTAAAPYRRISKAVSQVTSGGTIWLADGTWDWAIDPELAINHEGLNCWDTALGVPGQRYDPIVTGTTIRAVNPGRVTIRFESTSALCLGTTQVHGLRFEAVRGVYAVMANVPGSSLLSGVSYANSTIRVQRGARLTIEPAGLASYGPTGKPGDIKESVMVLDPGSEVVVNGGAFDDVNSAGGNGTEPRPHVCGSRGAFVAKNGARLVLNGVDVRRGARRTGDHPVAVAVSLCDGASAELKGRTAISGFAPWGAAIAVSGGTVTVRDGSVLRGNQYGLVSYSYHPESRADVTLSEGAAIEGSLVDGISMESTLSDFYGPSAIPSLRVGPGTVVRDSGRHGIFVTGTAAGSRGVNVVVDGATITGNAGTGLQVESSYDCRLRNSTLTGNVGFGIHLWARAVCDLGTAASPGGNTLRNTGPNLKVATLYVGVLEIEIQAIGNVWNPNEQGADGQGRYAVPQGQTGPLIVVAPVNSGSNYQLQWYGPGNSKPVLRLAQ